MQTAMVKSTIYYYGSCLERHVTISTEGLALFVRFWLTMSSPLPDIAQPVA